MAGTSIKQPPVDDDLEYIGDLQPILKELPALQQLLGSEYKKLSNDFDFDEWERPRAFGEGLEPRSAIAPLEERIRLVNIALASNRALQKRLRRLRTSVEGAQDKAVNVRDRVQATLRRRHVAAAAPRSHTGHKQHEEYTGSSSFWASPDAPPPPPYPGSADVLQVTSKLPLVFRRTYWNDEERRMLREGVLQLVQESQLNDLLGEMEAAAAATGGGVSLEEYQIRQAPIAQLTELSPEVETAAEKLTDLQWDAVAHRCVPGRTATECKLQWQNAARPSFKHGPFTAEEDTQLQALVQEHGDRHWMKISESLGTRPAVKCLARYQELQQAQRAHREFNLAEFERLSQLCRTHGSSWKRIAEEFGGNWDAEQLMHVWRRHAQRTAGGAVAPRVGRWNHEEDEILHKAVALLGRKWSEVAKLVPGRTDVQCRERYMNVLAPEVKNKGAFTAEEDAILQAAVPVCTSETGAVSWAAVAKQLSGRTDRQCGKRWGFLSNAETSGAGAGGSGSRGGGGGGRVSGRQETQPRGGQKKPGRGTSKAAGGASKRKKSAAVKEEEVKEEEPPRLNARGRQLKRPPRFYE